MDEKIRTYLNRRHEIYSKGPAWGKLKKGTELLSIDEKTEIIIPSGLSEKEKEKRRIDYANNANLRIREEEEKDNDQTGESL